MRKNIVFFCFVRKDIKGDRMMKKQKIAVLGPVLGEQLSLRYSTITDTRSVFGETSLNKLMKSTKNIPIPAILKM